MEYKINRYLQQQSILQNYLPEYADMNRYILPTKHEDEIVHDLDCCGCKYDLNMNPIGVKKDAIILKLMLEIEDLKQSLINDEEIIGLKKRIECLTNEKKKFKNDAEILKSEIDMLKWNEELFKYL